jgi:acyl dehydratase
MAHTFASLTVGDSFTDTRTITADDVRTFAAVTGDDNPIHLDEAAAAASRFGRPVVHGVFLLGMASKVLGRDFPGDGSIAVSLEARFLRPVPVGETVRLEVQVAEKIESRGHVRMKMYGYVGSKMAFGGEAVVIPPPGDEA